MIPASVAKSIVNDLRNLTFSHSTIETEIIPAIEKKIRSTCQQGKTEFTIWYCREVDAAIEDFAMFLRNVIARMKVVEILQANGYKCEESKAASFEWLKVSWE